MALPPKKRRFVDEYLIDLNATQAAIRAGFSARTAYSAGQRLLKNVEVASAIKDAQVALAERTGITQERVIRELARIGFADVRQLYDSKGNLKNIQDMDDETASALAGIETESKSVKADGDEDDEFILTTVRKVKRWDKVRALELIGKQLGMFVEHHEVGGKVTIVFDDPTARPAELTYERKPSPNGHA